MTPEVPEAFAMGAEALSELKGLREDVQSIGSDVSGVLDAVEGIASGPEEVPLSDEPELKALPKPDEAEPQASYEVPAADASAADWQADMAQMAYMQTVLQCFLLFAVLLNLGAVLWLSFSDKWRS